MSILLFISLNNIKKLYELYHIFKDFVHDLFLYCL